METIRNVAEKRCNQYYLLNKGEKVVFEPSGFNEAIDLATKSHNGVFEALYQLKACGLNKVSRNINKAVKTLNQ